ncbi:dUTP diphosphatase [Acetobacteraceae bacterium]|nr:dUTP diphosphatase [Acetobacteraceae bacterium]
MKSFVLKEKHMSESQAHPVIKAGPVKIIFIKAEGKPYSNNIQFPTKATKYSTGYDIHSAVDITIPAGKHAIVPTGLKFKIPDKAPIDFQVRSRSGLSVKRRVAVTNSPGTIDRDYTSELDIPLTNYSDEDFHIKVGDRIAQMVFNQLAEVDLPQAVTLNKERGGNDFGDSGL